MPPLQVLSVFFKKNHVPTCIRLSGKEGKDKSKGRFNEGGWRRGCRTKFPALTVEAGEVSPVEQGAVEGGQGGVEERIGAVGWVSDGVGEQVHLQQGLDQVAQHLAAQRDLHSPFGFTVTLYLSVLLEVRVCALLNLLCLLTRCWEDFKRCPFDPKLIQIFKKCLKMWRKMISEKAD